MKRPYVEAGFEKKMIQKFEETGDLDVRQGKGRKQISNITVEVAFAIVEKDFGSQYPASSAQTISRDLSLPFSTDFEVHSNVVSIQDQLYASAETSRSE